MKYLFLGYKKCSTSNKAEKLLKKYHVNYQFRDIVTNNPTVSELKSWVSKSGLPIKRFFNASGLVYKELKLKDKLATMTDDEQIELLSTNGMLVKRPILIGEELILVGFKEQEFEKLRK